MPKSNVFNTDCLEYMKTVPDKYYDLLIADPPYGGGADTKAFTEDEKGAHFVGRGRGKKYAEILNVNSQIVNVERERERELPEGLQGGSGEYHGSIVGRFGGLFAKYHLGESDGRHMGDEVSDAHRGYL